MHRTIGVVELGEYHLVIGIYRSKRFGVAGESSLAVVYRNAQDRYGLDTQMTKDGLIDSSLKSKTSNRTISLERRELDGLRSWKKRQAEERLAASIRYLTEHDLHRSLRPNRFVFTCTDGKPPLARAFGRWFGMRVRESGYEPRLTLHGMRHFARRDLVAEAGWPMEHISRRLGHSEISMTDRYYGHIDGKLVGNDSG